MKSFTFAIVAAAGLALGSSAFAQSIGLIQPDLPHAPGMSAAGELSLNVESHDFGTIDDTTPQRVDIGFKNTGTGILTVTHVSATCGCTVPQLTKTTYAPGETGTINVSFNPHNKRGQQQQTVTINSNDPKNPTKQVIIKSNVNPLVSMDPQVIQFGQVPKGKGAKQIVKVTGRIPDFSATGVTTSNVQLIDAKILGTNPGKTDDGSQATISEIEVSLLPSAPVGQVQGTATIRTTDANRILNLTILGEVTGDVQAVPPRASLGALEQGAPINLQIRLTSRSGANFKILKAEEVSTDAMTKLSLKVVQDDPEKLNSYTLLVTGTAPSAPGSLKGDIVLTTDIVGEEQVKLPYFGYVRAPTPPAANGMPTSPTGAPVPSVTPGKVAMPPAVGPSPAPVPQKPVQPK